MTSIKLFIRGDIIGGNYLIPPGNGPNRPKFPIMDLMAQYILKGDDVAIVYYEYIDTLGCMPAIIEFGMS